MLNILLILIGAYNYRSEATLLFPIFLVQNLFLIIAFLNTNTAGDVNLCNMKY